MRAINRANRMLSLVTLGLGIVVGVVAAPAGGAAVVGPAAAAAPSCVMASDPPVRIWRDGRFAGR